jgi:DNA-binding NtrC family response regulator
MNETPSATLSLMEPPRRAGAGRPCLYLVLEAGRPRAGSLRLSLHGIDEVHVGRGDARSWTRRSENGVDRLELQVPDRHLSGEHFRLLRVGNTLLAEDRGSKNGTLVRGTPAAREPVHDGDLIQAGETFFVYRDGALPEHAHPAVELGAAAGSGALATLVPAFAEQLERIRSVAPTDVPVVLHGETGTGKELIARALHGLSGREGPFVAVNCGALPATLVESELFGYRKGAFSGALEDRPGLVRSAAQGTLFLDEIGDLPLVAQASLLRVLQEREVRPVGGTAPVSVDVRVVCATHRDLRAMVVEGTFRADLLARLAGFTAELPPLRDRREDLGLIASTLLARLAPGERPVRFTPGAARVLLEFPWPGNVRELEQALARALALAGGERIAEEHLDLKSMPAAPPPSRKPLSEEDLKLRDELLRTLEAVGGNVSEAARVMHKDRKQIRRWIDRFGLGRGRG